MVTFLDEASNLDLLGLHVTKIERILDGLDEINRETEEKLETAMCAAAELCTRVISSELIFPSQVQVALKQASRFVPVYQNLSTDNSQKQAEVIAA